MTITSDFDSMAFRRALGNFATGITVITARDASGNRAGVTANSFNSVSLEPPLILWSIDKKSGSFPIFESATHFAVNILAADQMDMSNHFAKRSEDKFAEINYEEGQGGAAILPNCAAVFECEKFDCLEGGDHWILIGKVERFTDAGRAPLIFHQGGYSLVMPAQNGTNTSEEESPTNKKLQENLYFLMLQAVRSYQTEYQPKQLATGLRTAEARIIFWLDSYGQLSKNVLSKQLSMPAADTQNAFEVLLGKGLIANKNDDEFELKPEGKAMANQLWKIALDQQTEMFSDIAEADINTFKRVLKTLINHQ